MNLKDMEAINMNEEINNVIAKIISKVNPEWNKLQIIRFVYLELGKYLEKNTDFFLSDKLDSLSLSVEEINNIYFDDKINTVTRNKNNQYQIICKSAALILKETYDRLGIECDMVHTSGDENKVLHWFIVAKDDYYNQYFLTLAADLPYIKNAFPTAHFANNIKYFDPSGKPVYVLPNNPNLIFNKTSCVTEEGIIVYGEELSHEVATYEQIKSLDETIGYGYLYEMTDILNERRYSDLFLSYIAENSKIYDIFRESFMIEKGEYTAIENMTEEQVNIFCKKLEEFVCSYILRNSDLKFDMNNPLYNSVVAILNMENLSENDKKLDKLDFIAKYKKKLKELYNTKNGKNINMLLMVYSIQIKLRQYIEFRKNVKDKKLLEEAKKDLSFNELNPLLNKLALSLISDKINFDKDEYIPLEYLVMKFEFMFPLVFDCSFNDISGVENNSFNIQGYSEQIVIIKNLLRKMFPEITIGNSECIEDYNYSYSPVDNRIQTFPLKNKKNGEYCIGFRFGVKENENTVQYIYIPSENLLRRRNPIEDKKLYWIVSQRFNNQIQTMENIEENVRTL